MVVPLRAVGQLVPFKGRKITILPGQRNPNGGFAGFAAATGLQLLAQVKSFAKPNNPHQPAPLREPDIFPGPSTLPSRQTEDC
jgi:hypothetical protein